ncbi:MAG: hypothetical protein RBT70_06245 [Alphaproteobacteria bacterium]|nr:hypothetical protein [Alphaproteobacteria bacterium]
MSLFLALLSRLFPLYATMGIGAGLGRAFGNMSGALAQLQFYLILPVVVLTNMMKMEFTADLLVMPVLYAVLCFGISSATFAFAKGCGVRFAPLMAQASGMCNAGYLGIPVATILFPENFIPVYILTMIGGTIYESTIGYYWMARGRYSPRDAVKSLLKMPLMYCLVVGLVLNKIGVHLPEMWQSLARDFLGAYVILGALIVGMGLAKNKSFKLHGKLLGFLFTAKFVVWPAVTVAALALLRLTPFAVPEMYEPILLLLSFLPLAANTAALASLLDVFPEEAATAVALSTLLSIGIIPAYVHFFGFAYGGL